MTDVELPITLDFAPARGGVVHIHGRATVFHARRRVFVEPLSCPQGVGLRTAGAALRGAVADCLVGCDALRAAVRCGYEVAS